MSSSISYNLPGLNWLFAAQLGSGFSEFQFKMIKDSSKVTYTRHESYYASWSVYIIIIIITLCYAENSKLFPHHGESLHHIDSMQQKMINVLHVLLIWISGGFGSSFVVNASLPIQSLRKMGPATKIFFLGPVGSVWLKIRRVLGSLGILL